MSASPSVRSMFRSSRVRRGFAACAVILAAGGLVLVRAPSHARGDAAVTSVASPSAPNTATTATFDGARAHGRFSLSHGKLLAGAPRTFYGELVLSADASEQAKARAPLSLAVVLDRSGSMGGEKLDRAKEAVIELVRTLDADDEIALVQYDNASEVIQPLARVGNVREALLAKVRAITDGGGTNIPPALAMGLDQLKEASRSHVRRVVLASDGLDSTRLLAEDIARKSAQQGITISSMGIGLDFDEGYMGGVAQAGRGNFAFVKDASALAGFLKREVKEGASTTIESATARITLPAGVRFVRATGADVRSLDDNVLELSMGSLFAGDERRVVIEMTGDVPAGELRKLGGTVSWGLVGGGNVNRDLDAIAIGGATDAREVEESRDGAVLASAVSALASVRQLEAIDAYNRGESGRAQALIGENEVALQAAASAAPAPVAAALDRQLADYGDAKRAFAAAPPKSAEGKAAAKASAAKDLANTNRNAF